MNHSYQDRSTAAKRSRVISSTPFYYGWVVVLAATLGKAMTIPGQTAGVSLFIDGFIADLDLSRSSVSMAYTVATLIGAASLTYVGRWIDRFGPRRSVVVITAAFAFACLFMGYVGGLITLFVGFTLLRALGQGSLSLASIHVVNLWFVRRRGTAVGLLGVGLALAMSFFPVLIEELISRFGWRTTYMLLGTALILFMMPIGALFFRGAPENFGLTPDSNNEDTDSPPEENVYTLRQARRTGMFWMLTGAGVFVGAVGTGMMFHHFSIMDVNGLSREVAAAMFIPFGIVTAVSNLGTGVLVDYMSPRRLMAGMLFIFAGTLVLGPFVSSLAVVWCYGLLFGLVQGMQDAIKGSVYAYYFGRAHIGAIKGFSQTLGVGGTAVGPLVFALGRDYLGSYVVSFGAAAVVAVLLGVAALVIKGREMQPVPGFKHAKQTVAG
jgi:sugar phosphate permease